MLHQIISATAARPSFTKGLQELFDVLLQIGMVLCALALICFAALRAICSFDGA